MDTIAGATVFKTASSTGRTRSVCEMAPPLGIAPSSHRLTGGPHTLCVERNALRGSAHRKRGAHSAQPQERQLLPAGIAPALFRLEGGCLRFARLRERMKWSRASVLPRVFAAPAAMQLPLRVCRLCASAHRVPRPKQGGLLSSSRAILKWRPVRALLPRPSARQAAALRS